jgi:hypothetical protein
MTEWWSQLSGMEQVYWGFAIPATIIFLVLLVLTLIGGEAEHVDINTDVDLDSDATPGGFQFITVKNLVGFFTVFGWAGISALQGGAGNTTSLIIASASGFGMMLLMAALFYYMSKLQHSGTLNISNAMNMTGEVYLTIPASKKGMGKVQIKIQGALRELEAMTDENEEIPTGRAIQVTGITQSDILIVRTINN